jgi:exodeoxyribonuclease-5
VNNTSDLYRQLITSLSFEPTVNQEQALQEIAEFVLHANAASVYLLKGYAGTGKTSIMKSLVSALPQVGYSTFLIAPTGRASKVLSTYTGQIAYTIHKKIYRRKNLADGLSRFVLSENKHSNCLFIVDEASMIPGFSMSENELFSSNSLLDDLMQYLQNGVNCKMLLIGDAAQLPPVGQAISPAMDEAFINGRYGNFYKSIELTKVLRQEAESGILRNATYLRQKLALDSFIYPFFKDEKKADFIRVEGSEMQETLENAINQYGLHNCVIITRSNKAANQYNMSIRHQILWQETAIDAGDLMMVVKNNYHWVQENNPLGFIANGDIIEIRKIVRTQELYGFQFADALIGFIDYPGEPEIEVKLLLNTIQSETPALNREESMSLYKAVEEDYQDIKTKKERSIKLKQDPYLNALQVKFAYAVTCHKAQGGQWDVVFVDQGYIKDEMIDRTYIRWLYTALTRAVKKLYLINFHEKMFS